MDNTELSYSAEQFANIKGARVVCRSISLTFDTIAFLMFLYLVFYHRSQANRTSLRLAAFSCLANIFENIFYILMMKIKGATRFCSALQYVGSYMSILGVSFLTLIGINLVVVYVLNLRNRQVLEWVYYPCAIIYSGIGIIGPIVQQYIADLPPSDNTDNTCWYITAVKGRYKHSMSYMWVYGFIFFSTVVALICSIISITKLVKDSRLIPNLFKHRPRAVSSQIPQAIIRCLLYPLVPLVTNFTGFVMQCIIDKPNITVGYTLTMANSVLRSLGGVLVALIFLNDPLITHILTGWYDHWCYKHIEEYVMVEIKEKDFKRVVDDDPGDSVPIVLVSFPPSKKKTMLHMAIVQPIFLLLYCWFKDTRKKHQHSWFRRKHEEVKDDNNRSNLVMGIDCEDLTRPLSNSDSSAAGDVKSRTIPMRRLKIPNERVNRCLENHAFMPKILVRRSFSKHIIVEEPVSGYFIVVNEENDDMSDLFIYYSSVRDAKFIHFLFNNPIGRAFHRGTNAMVDVDISIEPLREGQHHHHHISSSDPTAEL